MCVCLRPLSSPTRRSRCTACPTLSIRRRWQSARSRARWRWRSAQRSGASHKSVARRVCPPASALVIPIPITLMYRLRRADPVGTPCGICIRQHLCREHCGGWSGCAVPTAYVCRRGGHPVDAHLSVALPRSARVRVLPRAPSGPHRAAPRCATPVDHGNLFYGPPPPRSCLCPTLIFSGFPCLTLWSHG